MIRRHRPAAALALAALAVTALAAPLPASEESRAGRMEYLASCASCHGTEARGDGPVAEALTVEVPDLTRIGARRGGRFPVREVMAIIDGRRGIRAHGGEMPVWGDRYRAEAGERWGPWGSGAEIYVRNRLLELAFYLESIQEDVT
jgi:mono/diheme cytochrome c family protein